MKDVLRCVFWIGALDLATWSGTTLVLGGDAVQGKIEGDRHFLGYQIRHPHGTIYTEVPVGTYRLMWWMDASVAVAFPASLIAALLLRRIAKREGIAFPAMLRASR